MQCEACRLLRQSLGYTRPFSVSALRPNAVATSSKVRVEDFIGERNGRRKRVSALTAAREDMHVNISHHLRHRQNVEARKAIASVKSLGKRDVRRAVWLFKQHGQSEQATQIVREWVEAGNTVKSESMFEWLHPVAGHGELDLATLEALIQILRERLNIDGPVTTSTGRLLSFAFESLLHLAQTSTMEELFALYLQKLRPGDTGNCRAWASIIKAEALDGEFVAAHRLFDAWHDLLRSSTGKVIDKEQPYIAILYAVRHQSKASRLVSSRLEDIGKRMLEDEIEPTSIVINSLLNLELGRQRFRSFWGLWEMVDRQAGYDRDETHWRLAARAFTAERAARARELRNQATPLPGLIGYSVSKTPSLRDLWRSFVRLHDRLTEGQLDVRLVRPIVTVKTLNSFLRAFVLDEDWEGATLVLHAFEVCRVEPDDKTHSAVILNVVRAWQKTRFRGSREWDLWEGEGITRRDAVAALQLIHNIRSRTNHANMDEEGRQLAAQEDDDFAAYQAQVKDLAYLKDLLRRCRGYLESRWDRAIRYLNRKIGVDMLASTDTMER